jgi:hypothetical protein
MKRSHFLLFSFLSIIVEFGRSSSSSDCILSDLQNYEQKIYSQNAEDGILLKLLESIGSTNKFYVEFGVESGVECNTRVLRELLGFTGLLMDSENENIDINLKKEFITADNILSLFRKHKVPKSFDVLSVDIDMFDWWILLRILRDGMYRPRVIIVETNPTLGLQNRNAMWSEFSYVNSIPLTVVHPNMTEQSGWDLSRYCGANPAAFQRLGQLFQYDMVILESICIIKNFCLAF